MIGTDILFISALWKGARSIEGAFLWLNLGQGMLAFSVP
jgi:hypothetical protein